MARGTSIMCNLCFLTKHLVCSTCTVVSPPDNRVCLPDALSRQGDNFFFFINIKSRIHMPNFNLMYLAHVSYYLNLTKATPLSKTPLSLFFNSATTRTSPLEDVVDSIVAPIYLAKCICIFTSHWVCAVKNSQAKM